MKRYNQLDQKKIIIFSANTSWYLKNFRESTIKRFISMGFTVFCISPKDSASDDLIELGCTFINLKINNKGLNPVEDLKLVYTIYQLYKSIKPDAVFNFTIKNNIYGSYASAFTGTKVYNHITGLGTAIIHGGLLSIFVKILYASSQLFATKIFCQNLDDYHFFTKNCLAPKSKLQIIPGSGINLNKFSNSSKELESLNENDDHFTFLYAGRILKDKGLFELVHAIDRVNSDGIKCNLKIYGFLDSQNVSAITKPDVLKWNKIPGVQWCGESKDIIKIIKKIDCVVLPSYREGMPRALLEAASLSKPIIATNVPGCKEIVKDGVNGFLCQSKSISSLEESILKMINLSYKERKKMGTAGRKIVEESFDEELVIQAAVDAIS
tara:strand:- start:206 stop:1348 length:1143 start_codon:yes stop_codon:yes gene_type:complete